MSAAGRVVPPGLNTTDHEGAWPFYAGLFNWRPAGPMEIPGGCFAAQCRNPQGAVFALFSMTR